MLRGLRINRRDRRLEGEIRFGGCAAGEKLTADGLSFAGVWSEMVSVSSDKGTRQVGQRPSEQVADNHCHHVSTNISGKDDTKTYIRQVLEAKQLTTAPGFVGFHGRLKAVPNKVSL